MLKKDNTINLENTGTNPGIMVGQNFGSITLQMQNQVKMPSHIGTIVKSLGSVSINSLKSTDLSLLEFKPEDKLTYNCVIQYRGIIEEYAKYYPICDDVMNLYDNSNLGSKNRILLWIKTCYLEHKGELMKTKGKDELEIDVIRGKADDLISKVIQHVRETVLQSAESNDTKQEDLDYGIYCFTCYCFMECHILEKPIC